MLARPERPGGAFAGGVNKQTPIPGGTGFAGSRVNPTPCNREPLFTGLNSSLNSRPPTPDRTRELSAYSAATGNC